MDAVQEPQSLNAAPERLRQSPERPSPCPSDESTQPSSRQRSPNGVERSLLLLQSRPFQQFKHQVSIEWRRIMMQIQPRVKGRKQKTLRVNLRLDRAKIAEQNVKNRWIEQGIWNDEWTTDKVGERWKHEEDPTPSPEPTPQPELPTQMTRERYVSNKPEKNERTSGITAEDGCTPTENYRISPLSSICLPSLQGA